MARSEEEFLIVQALTESGLNDCEVSRLTGVPRSTVRDWRRGLGDRATRSPRGGSGSECAGGHDFSAVPPLPYSYLLGLYLGDGCISAAHSGVWRLRVVLDAAYPGIIAECGLAMEAIMPGKRAHRLARRSHCVEVSMYSKHWPCFFPQHGPGRKHNRAIRLVGWQEHLLEQEAFVRGLMHSDGCRIVVNDRGVMSVRYHFSNRSDDIKRLLCTSLDSLGIYWTRPSSREIAIYRKADVARLDQFIGPKR